ncbi:tRNA pseudouridine(55) synthase TruB [Isosphaeraceae bacterium EP7]
MTTPSTVAAPCGLLNLNKPSGWTSRAAVDRVTRIWRKTKVGHAGTLDPLASGVLVLCVGQATRLIEYVQQMPKSYRTVVLLGSRSDTLDADGTVVADPTAVAPERAAVEQAVASQVGVIQQIPPQFSALKREGKRAYDLARAGVVVDLAARAVTITRVEILSYEWPRLTLEVDCGSGTYIRSIARDIGEMLGCGGMVEVLIRTKIGPFTVEDAVDPDTLDAENLAELLRPPIGAVPSLPRVNLVDAQIVDILQGRPLRIDDPAIPAGEVAMMGPDGRLAAIGEWKPEEGKLWPRRVLASMPVIA